MIWVIILFILIVIIGMFFMDMLYVNLIMWIFFILVVFWLGRGFFINVWK